MLEDAAEFVDEPGLGDADREVVWHTITKKERRRRRRI
jgi:hypothetical protein